MGHALWERLQTPIPGALVVSAADRSVDRLRAAQKERDRVLRAVRGELFPGDCDAAEPKAAGGDVPMASLENDDYIDDASDEGDDGEGGSAEEMETEAGAGTSEAGSAGQQSAPTVGRAGRLSAKERKALKKRAKAAKSSGDDGDGDDGLLKRKDAVAAGKTSTGQEEGEAEREEEPDKAEPEDLPEALREASIEAPPEHVALDDDEEAAAQAALLTGAPDEAEDPERGQDFGALAPLYRPLRYAPTVLRAVMAYILAPTKHFDERAETRAMPRARAADVAEGGVRGLHDPMKRMMTKGEEGEGEEEAEVKERGESEDEDEDGEEEEVSGGEEVGEEEEGEEAKKENGKAKKARPQEADEEEAGEGKGKERARAADAKDDLLADDGGEDAVGAPATVADLTQSGDGCTVPAERLATLLQNKFACLALLAVLSALHERATAPTPSAPTVSAPAAPAPASSAPNAAAKDTPVSSARSDASAARDLVTRQLNDEDRREFADTEHRLCALLAEVLSRPIPRVAAASPAAVSSPEEGTNEHNHPSITEVAAPGAAEPGGLFDPLADGAASRVVKHVIHVTGTTEPDLLARPLWARLEPALATHAAGPTAFVLAALADVLPEAAAALEHLVASGAVRSDMGPGPALLTRRPWASAAGGAGDGAKPHFQRQRGKLRADGAGKKRPKKAEQQEPPASSSESSSGAPSTPSRATKVAASKPTAAVTPVPPARVETGDGDAEDDIDEDDEAFMTPKSHLADSTPVKSTRTPAKTTPRAGAVRTPTGNARHSAKNSPNPFANLAQAAAEAKATKIAAKREARQAAKEAAAAKQAA